MNVQWNESYCVGNERIDTQHAYLFDLANDIFAARQKAELRLCFIHLYKYMRQHFADEEALMREVDFPAYQQHIDMHFALIAQLNALSTRIDSGQWNAQDVHTFMHQGLLKHILKEDSKLAELVRQNSAFATFTESTAGAL